MSVSIIPTTEILTGWYRQRICGNLNIRGTSSQASSVECKEGGDCTELTTADISVERGVATPTKKVESCPRRISVITL